MEAENQEAFEERDPVDEEPESAPAAVEDEERLVDEEGEQLGR